jgi:rare lipoprotein A
VTNLQNGKSSVVRVNDRGPFHSERLIDLSYAAAVKLGFHQQGTTQVLVEALAADTAPSQEPLIQVGSFSDREQAASALSQIQSIIRVSAQIVRSAPSLYSLQIGPVLAGAELERVKALLTTMDFGQIIVLPSQ